MIKETVVLLHGVGHSRWNMVALWLFLRLDKYDVINLSYPSTRLPLSTIIDWTSTLKEACMDLGGSYAKK